jgi:asparagine synthase (glutamine-hydrolysing)
LEVTVEGIFGVFSFDNLVSQEVLDRMARSLGSWPEASFLLDGQFGIGVRRLPLVAETQTPKPVCANNGSLCVAVNGEIHNSQELRHQLERRGYVFSSCSDGELIANLYRDRGEEFLKQLNGLFVVAIWDRRAQEIILAQDRYGGIRQFYYASLTNSLIFASSIRPILASGKVVPQVDESAFIEFFTIGRVLPPHTMFQGVEKLIPGHIMRCRAGSISTKLVNGFTFAPKLTANDVDSLTKYYAESVEKSLIADRPIALLLSGGLDTSLNVAMASKLAHKPLTTFSVRFADRALDESPYSRLVANQFATDHHELTLDSSDALEALPQIVWCQEEPLWDHSAVPSYHLACYAKSYVDAVIAGDGPDHLCGRYYHLAARRRFFNTIPGSHLLGKLLTRRLDRGFSRYYPIRAIQKIAQVAHEPLDKCYKDIICSYHLWHAPNAEGANRIFSDAVRANSYAQVNQTQLIPSYVREDFNRLVVCDFIVEGSFGVFSKFGKVAAGQSLLIREPFFDNALVDHLNRLPADLKVRGNLYQLLRGTAEKKYVLRHTLGRQLLPQAVLTKPKAGFTPPMGQWLREKLQEIGPKAVLTPSIKQAGFFDTAFVEILVKEHLSNIKDNTLVLYMLLVFAVWHSLYIDTLTTECPTMKLTDLLHS